MEQCCQDKINVAIVGGGPAGIFCALNLLNLFAENNFDNFRLDIFDKGQILRTILPTGGGRCNITNSIFDIKEFVLNYPRGEKFLYSLFSRHFVDDTLSFFEKIGIQTYMQDDGRIFPKSNSAKDVKDKMLNAIKKYKNVKFIYKNIESFDEIKNYDYKIISIGSRGVSSFLETINQPFLSFRPVLCGLEIEDFDFPVGISVKALDGDFVTTETGISGPLPFRISSLCVDKKLPFEILIKLFDYNELIKLVKDNPKKSIGTLVSKFVPKSFARAYVKEYDINSAEISIDKIKSYSFLKLIVKSYSKKGEIVNSGGINLKYIDKNCKSKLIENLWFCGEVLDVDGFCGGFNLQNCWSSASVVANDVISSIINKTK